MNFSYKSYVNRFKYLPYQWPPDIGLAELHSRVSYPGPAQEDPIECPCCGGKSKHKITSWLTRDINEDCRGFGMAIPAYFGLLKFYGVCMLLVIAINTIYPLVATYDVCANFDTDHQCLQSGALYYLDFNTMIELLYYHGQQDVASKMIVLQTVVFYLLLLANLTNLFYLAHMKRTEDKYIISASAIENALIVHNAPVAEAAYLLATLATESKIDIVKIIKLKEIKNYYDSFMKRNQLYYTLLSKYVINEDPRKYLKLNEKLLAASYQCKVYSKKLDKSYGSIIVVFGSAAMARQVYNNYSLSAFRKILFGSRELIKEWGISKYIAYLPLNVVRLPPVRELRWESAGYQIRSKLAGRIKTFLIAVGLVLACYFLLQEPMKLALHEHSGNADLGLFQKILPIVLSFGLVALSYLYRNYMNEVSKRRNPLNEYEHCKFVLMTSVLFHFVFYLIIPTVFFTVNNGINSTVKLYVISYQARTFIFMQVVLSAIDMTFLIWKRRKVRNLSDQRMGFRYSQQTLHKTVYYRDYPLYYRLQTIFRIWSFALFYSFFLPYMMIYMLVAVICLYLLEKKNFYTHYTLRRKISLKLETEFLTYYVNFFCVFQCFVYCLHVTADWMYYSAIVATAASLVSNLVYWNFVQPKKEDMSALKQQLLQSEDAAKESQLSALAVAEEYEQSYTKFIDSIRNYYLSHYIDKYLYQAYLPEQYKPTSTKKLIELVYTDQYNLSD